MAFVILEQTHDTPLTDEEYSRFAKRVDPCLEQYGAQWVRSFLSDDRRRVICQFEAPDAEAVRAAHREADVPFERVWAAQVWEHPATVSGQSVAAE